jgi:hypothetical protein
MTHHFGKEDLQNAFVINDNPAEVYSPREFGFKSVQWAILTLSDLTEITLKNPSDSTAEQLSDRLKKNPMILHYLLIAYGTALNYVFCIASTAKNNIPEIVSEEIFSGIFQGICELQTNGENIVEQNAIKLFKTTGKYINLLFEEMKELPRNPDVINPDSELSIESLYNDIIKAYDPNQTLIHQETLINDILIKRFISYYRSNLIVTMKNAIKIEYIY